MTRLLLAFAACSLLSACVVYDGPPRGRPVHVEYKDYDHHPRHCPPGHRKKGWC